MATGIVFGRIVDSTGAAMPALRVLLDTVRRVGAGFSGPLAIEPAGAPVYGNPPYGIASNTNAEGRYVLCYRWSGVNVGDQAAACQFRVVAWRDNVQCVRVGAASRTGGVVGLDLRSLLSQVTPLDAFAGGSDSASTWFNLIAEYQRTLSRTSSLIRGMMGDGNSADRYLIATRIDFRCAR